MDVFKDIPNVELNIAQLKLMASFLTGEEFMKTVMAVVDAITRGEKMELKYREQCFFNTLYANALKRAQGWQGRVNAGKARAKQ